MTLTLRLAKENVLRAGRRVLKGLAGIEIAVIIDGGGRRHGFGILN